MPLPLAIDKDDSGAFAISNVTSAAASSTVRPSCSTVFAAWLGAHPSAARNPARTPIKPSPTHRPSATSPIDSEHYGSSYFAGWLQDKKKPALGGFLVNT